MDMHDVQHEPEVEFDIDVELPPELDAPWADDSDVIELSASAVG